MRLVVDGEIWQRQAAGGISRLYNEVLPRLCNLAPDLRITLITDGALKQPPPAHAAITPRAMPAYQKLLRPGRLWRRQIMRLKRATRDRWTQPTRSTIWQATYYTPPPAWPGRFAVVVHDLIEERYPQFFDQPRHEQVRRSKRDCVHASDLVICNSVTTRQDVCDFFGIAASKTRLVTLAASPVFRRLAPNEVSASPSAPPVPYVLYVGDRSAYKNFEFLLRGYASWSGRDDVSLVVVGPKFTPQELALIASLGVTERVSSYVNIDDATLCRFYNQAQAFVYPSLYEGFGIPLLEAMACGCPLVASAIPTTRDVAGDIPFYFEPTDAAGLQAALSAALAAPPGDAGRAERIRAGIERAGAFSWDATAGQFLAIYRELEAWAT